MSNNMLNFKEQKQLLQQRKKYFKAHPYKSKIIVIFQTIIILLAVAAMLHYCTTN